MADIINLRQHRKQKGREEKEKQAEQNRIKFGRTKDQKKRDAFEKKKALSELELKRLEKKLEE
ncbi:DUF4169 family protein [Terasakiella pusilla]|uniref:DUF4169 family protein n=1 Tax=Terasakiella pusilla TaxID=64973 RepID=UPI00048FD6E8|nr:DUF4169 family protein [Terasakiella pusilla]